MTNINKAQIKKTTHLFIYKRLKMFMFSPEWIQTELNWNLQQVRWCFQTLDNMVHPLAAPMLLHHAACLSKGDHSYNITVLQTINNNMSHIHKTTMVCYCTLVSCSLDERWLSAVFSWDFLLTNIITRSAGICIKLNLNSFRDDLLSPSRWKQ